jgi:predicted thioesterase
LASEHENAHPTPPSNPGTAPAASAAAGAFVVPLGSQGRHEITVAHEHTAPHVGSGKVEVLATPVLVNLMEAAALHAAEHFLPAGYQSLGTRLDIRHIAATPVGMKVVATAEVIKVEGRMITFRVEARDEKELVGDGTHDRVVVNVARFDQRVQDKLAKA